MAKRYKEIKVEKGMWLAPIWLRAQVAVTEFQSTEIEDVLKGASPFFSNEHIINKSESCICAFDDCHEVFTPKDIKEWVDDEGGRTAMCPKCHVDMIVGDYILEPLIHDRAWCEKHGLIKPIPEFNFENIANFMTWISYLKKDEHWEKNFSFNGFTGSDNKIIICYEDYNTIDSDGDGTYHEDAIPADMFDRYMYELGRKKSKK